MLTKYKIVPTILVIYKIKLQYNVQISKFLITFLQAEYLFHNLLNTQYNIRLHME